MIAMEDFKPFMANKNTKSSYGWWMNGHGMFFKRSTEWYWVIHVSPKLDSPQKRH